MQDGNGWKRRAVGVLAVLIIGAIIGGAAVAGVPGWLDTLASTRAEWQRAAGERAIMEAAAAAVRADTAIATVLPVLIIGAACFGFVGVVLAFLYMMQARGGAK